MPNVRYKLVVTRSERWQDPVDDRVGGYIYYFDYWEFNTTSKSVVTGSGTQQEDYGGPSVEDAETIGIVWSECVPNTTTRRIWEHLDHQGTVEYREDEQATECGYTGQTCDLQLSGSVQGFTATGVASGAHGTVRYSLDNGASSQTSPVFTALQPDRDYEMLAIDDGVGNSCRARWAFRINSSSEPPFTPPPAAPVGVDFSLHPIWYSVPAAPGQEAVLDLYVENQHYGAFRRVVRLRARGDAGGQVAFRLDATLHRQLGAFTPPAVAVGTVASRGNVRNYFVRTALVEPSSGQPGAFALGPVRTVLRGGLPVELRDVPYLAQRAASSTPAFLSWQPRAKRLTPAQPEWWLWLCPAGTPRKLTVFRRYRAGGLLNTIQETVQVAPLLQNVAHRVLAVPVLQGAVPGVDRVELWLEDQGGRVLSELLVFEVAEATPRSRYFLFSNSLGGCDTLHATGRSEATLDTRQDVATRPRQPGTPATAALSFVAAADPSRRVRANTGPLTDAQWAWLQEFVYARERWEQLGPRLVPLLLGKGALAYARDDRPMGGYAFEYDYAPDPVAYANLT